MVYERISLTYRQLEIFDISLQPHCRAKQSEEEAILSNIVDPSDHDVSSFQIPIQHGSSLVIGHLHE